MQGTRTMAAAILMAASHTPVVLAQGIELDPIIVTGERRDTPLVQTTGAVSVIDGDDAARDGGDTTIDIVVTQTPNVFIEGPSEVPSIRGVQGGGAGGLPSALSTGTLPRTTIIRDGIARPASIANSSFTTLWDVEQVEVLRGPQTLLRGRAGFAGAVIVETKDPTFEVESAAQGGIRFDDFGGPEYTGAAMVSGPLSNSVAGRLVVEGGYGDDPRRVTGGSADIITEYDRLGARGKLLGLFDTDYGALETELMLEHQIGQTPQTRNTVLGPVPTGADPADRLFPFDGPARTFDTDASAAALSFTLDNETWRLTSITGFVSESVESVPEQPEPTFFDVDEQIYSQEFLLAFGPEAAPSAGGVGGLIGLAFEERRSETGYEGVLTGKLDVESSSQAVFADFRYGLTDRLTLEAGARVQRFADERKQTSRAVLGPIDVSGAQDYEEEEVEFLPRLGLAFRPDDNQLLSASIRRGYNPGGASVNFFNGQPYEYESERVWTAEAVYRLASPANRLTLGTTAFYNWFDNPQFFAELVPGNRGTLQIINQDSGISFGAEFEATWAATDDLVVDASLGLLETKITEAAADTLQLEGNSFGQDPTITASLGVTYALTEWLSADGRATYRGESENDFNNIDGEEVGDYFIVDLGVTARYRAAELRAFVNNATDTAGITRRIGGNNFVDVTEPLTVGLTLTARF